MALNLTSAFMPGQEEDLMKSLLLSKEFADIPDIVRDDLEHDVLLLEAYQEPRKVTPM